MQVQKEATISLTKAMQAWRSRDGSCKQVTQGIKFMKAIFKMDSDLDGEQEADVQTRESQLSLAAQ